MFPQFEGETLDVAVIRDRSGIVTGCRWIGQAERMGLWGSFQPRLPDVARAGQVHVTRDPSQESVILFWIVSDCDREAEVTISSAPGGLAVDVTQVRSGECAPGTATTLLELTTQRDLNAGDVQRRFRYEDS